MQNDMSIIFDNQQSTLIIQSRQAKSSEIYLILFINYYVKNTMSIIAKNQRKSITVKK